MSSTTFPLGYDSTTQQFQKEQEDQDIASTHQRGASLSSYIQSEDSARNVRGKIFNFNKNNKKYLLF